MAFYRKKPVVIEAIQWTGTVASWDEVCEFLPVPEKGHGIESDTVVIHTLEGDMRASVGDWIIRGVKGEVYPCKPDIFEATYERAIIITDAVPC